MTTSILLAADQALFRQGIRYIINSEANLKIIGEIATPQETLSHTLILQPDILLLDLAIPMREQLILVRQLTAAKSSTKIMILTMNHATPYLLEALECGVSGYILKDIIPTLLIYAIHLIKAGESFISPRLLENLLGKSTTKNTADPVKKACELAQKCQATELTLREKDILACIAKGCSNHDIAATLYISEKTVKNHLSHIFHKINVKDRTQALIYGLTHNIVTLD